MRLYITDTLGNPFAEQEWIPQMLEPLAESRRAANLIKRQEPITVVIGNPPYKEKAKGRGGWIEAGSPDMKAPLQEWMPPSGWGVGAHAKHLRNLYVYFWRWATWKVFDPPAPPSDIDASSDAGASSKAGIVCFITVAGFLNGPGFEKMRDYLRRSTEEVWVVDCSPEGHQPEVPTRVFQDVQQPVCIVLASRTARNDLARPARVRSRTLPLGPRAEKFAALDEISLDSDGWVDCSDDWRAPFLPAAVGAWATYPSLDDLFEYNGAGVMPGRTWVIAPDAGSLLARWKCLTAEKDPDGKELLFHPHLRHGAPGDKHVRKAVAAGLAGHEYRPGTVLKDNRPAIKPTRYAFRSFDRQWIIPDARLINQPNPTLWRAHSTRQVYLTALDHPAPTSGPGLTLTGLVPDLHHFSGRGGRVYLLWLDASATIPNINSALTQLLAATYDREVTPDEVMANVAAIVASPAYTARFKTNLVSPPLRLPLTADPALFNSAVELGREVVWLHTYGERFTDPGSGRPYGPPRLPQDRAPRIPADGAIPSGADDMPRTIDYDPSKQRLLVGKGYVDNVPPEVWAYEIAGHPVLRHWFSYRGADRSRPIMGDRRPPSPLGDMRPPGWIADYTTDLLDLLHVLGRLVDLEPEQARLLDSVCSGPTIDGAVLSAATLETSPPGPPSRRSRMAVHRDQLSLPD